MKLFIDTNVLLSFFHFSSSTLDELDTLGQILSEHDLEFLTTDQLLAEFRRNRHVKIADALKRFNDQCKVGRQFPQFVQGYPEYEEMRKAADAYDKAKSELQSILAHDCHSEKLQADEVLQDLLARGRKLPVTEDILAKARERIDLGNPPGQEGNYGDAVNWECLLEVSGPEEHLVLVSEDKHYRSRIRDDAFHPYLAKEWTRVTCGGEVSYYQSLTEFLNNVPLQFRFAEEREKDTLIEELAFGENFQAARGALHKLVRVQDFTDSQINQIAHAVTTNNQVYWIIGDSDINRMVRQLIGGRESAVDPETLTRLHNLLEGRPSDEVNPIYL